MPSKTMPPKDHATSGALKPEDFDSIREAVLETPRGRWFLNEFASRLRAAESASLADGMKRLENAVAANHDALMLRLSEALARPSGEAAAPAPQAEIAPRHMKFFKQDEEIFAPAPNAMIAAVPPAEEKPKKDERRRATRMIRKEGPALGAAAVAEPVPLAEAAPAEAAPAPQPPAAAKRRIVIIRHKPGEEIAVPLADEFAKAS